jgi:sec-independent protein translocase protein TatA
LGVGIVGQRGAFSGAVRWLGSAPCCSGVSMRVDEDKMNIWNEKERVYHDESTEEIKMLTPETMLIVAGAAFLLFGGKKLPELGRSLGHGIREFKAGTQGLKDELNAQVAGNDATPIGVPQAMTIAAGHAVSLPSAPLNTVTILSSTTAPAVSQNDEHKVEGDLTLRR